MWLLIKGVKDWTSKIFLLLLVAGIPVSYGLGYKDGLIASSSPQGQAIAQIINFFGGKK